MLWGPDLPWTVEEVIMDDSKAGEALIRMVAAGLCRFWWATGHHGMGLFGVCRKDHAGRHRRGFGMGGVGSEAVQGAALAGARQVLGVGLSSFKHAEAKCRDRTRRHQVLTGSARDGCNPSPGAGSEGFDALLAPSDGGSQTIGKSNQFDATHNVEVEMSE